jgi:hypothetical protein
MPVHCLRPNVTADEAVAMFHGAGASRLLRRIASGPLRRVAPLYVPFRAYRVNISNGRRHRRAGAPGWDNDEQFFAVDAVTGALDLYQFAELPTRDDLVVVETRNRIAPALDDDATREKVTEKVRRALYQTGFFRLRSLHIDAHAAALPDVHVPYWVGFFAGGRDRVRLAVVDAVRRRSEGARVRDLVRGWLASD